MSAGNLTGKIIQMGLGVHTVLYMIVASLFCWLEVYNNSELSRFPKFFFASIFFQIHLVDQIPYMYCTMYMYI